MKKRLTALAALLALALSLSGCGLFGRSRQAIETPPPLPTTTSDLATPETSATPLPLVDGRVSGRTDGLGDGAARPVRRGRRRLEPIRLYRPGGYAICLAYALGTLGRGLAEARVGFGEHERRGRRRAA